MRVERITGSKRSARDAVAIWLALLGLYLLFSDSVSLGEIAAGIACASLATLWWWGVGRRGGVRFRFGGGVLHPLPSALAGLPARVLRVGVRLAASGSRGGAVVERPASAFGWAVPEGESAPAARAMGVLSASLAPDGYVLRLDGGNGTVALHDIAGSRNHGGAHERGQA